VVVIRKGKEQTARIKLGRLEDGDKLASADDDQSGRAAPEKKLPDSGVVFGMKLGALDDVLRQRFGIADTVSGGVVVTDVTADSASAEKGIAAGDVITEITQQAVSRPKDVTDRIAALKSQGRKAVLLMLAAKNGDLRFVTIRIDG
jgi:serine protease Do